MAALIQPFNANNYDPTQGVGQLPVGRHPVIVESSEVKGNKANDGGYLQLNLKVIDGPAAGNTGAYRLNLYHSNPQTVEIANRQLSAISHVTGVFMIQDSAQLHNIPFLVEVGTQKPTREQEEARARGETVNLYTEVKKVFDVNGNEPGKQGQGGGAAQPQQGQQGQQQGFGGGQQQPQGGQGGAWGGSGAGQQQNPQGQGNGQGWQGGNAGQGNGQPQGGGFQPPQGGQQQQAPQNGGSAWGGAPQGQQQQPQGQNNGGQGGGWQQGNGQGGGAAPWGGGQ